MLNSKMIAAASLLLLTTACFDKDKEKDSKTSIPVRKFSSENATFSSYSVTPFEKRCEGIINFLQNLKDEAGNNIETSQATCRIDTEYLESTSVNRLAYEVNFKLTENKETYTAKVNLSGAAAWVSYLVNGAYLSPSETPVSTNIQGTFAGIEKSLKEWNLKDQDLPLTIMGELNDDFAKRVVEIYSNPSTSPYLGETKTKVELIPFEKSLSTGKVKLLEVDAGALEKEFLFCKDQACLDSAEILYSLQGNMLLIYRVKFVNDYPSIVTYIFKVSDK